MRAGAAATPADRALFDVALTVSAMRLLQSAHWGRVDPRLVGFDYDVSAKRLDLAAALRSARDAGGLPAAIAAAEPQFPVYRRLVKALADYRALRRGGRAGAGAGARRQAEEGRAGQALGRASPPSPRGCAPSATCPRTPPRPRRPPTARPSTPARSWTR